MFEAMNGITKGQVFRYMFMPQVLPRLRELFSSGFTTLAYMMALVYRSINLIPASNPIYTAQRRDNLSLREVIATASAHLKYTRDHIDQVIVFFLILIGMVILGLQFVLTMVFVMINPALAADGMPTTYAEFFETPDYDHDIAYRLLYAVFGVPDLFKPSGSVNPFHTALYSLFQLYSIGLLVIAVFIVCYFIFAIVAETAQTGVPFGKRYNHVWTPIRLVCALGLLMPVGYGLNSAQWITLYSAKFGSDFATKGWVIFNDKMSDAYLKDPKERVGKPQVPDIVPFATFMTVALACENAYETLMPEGSKVRTIRIEGYLINSPDAVADGAPPTLATGDIANSSGSPDDRDNKKPQDIVIRFGEYNKDEYSTDLRSVHPYCGDLVIYAADPNEEGSMVMQKYYLDLVRQIWNGEYGLKDAAAKIVKKYMTMGGNNSFEDADPNYRSQAIDKMREDIAKKIDEAVEKQGSSQTWNKNNDNVKKLGWGGAGIWYNKIAQINGSLVTAVNNVPEVRSMPLVMDYIKGKQLQQNRNVTDVFKQNLSDGEKIQMNNYWDEMAAAPLSITYDGWVQDDAVGKLSNQTARTGNIFIDVINWIFGTRGLYAMCQNSDVHPLAQLSQLGKGMVEASIRNIFASVVMTGFSLLGPYVGAVAAPAASIAMSIASITIILGFMLYYILPFMPFLYFFFAVGGWIKGLFEAMVGVPLWALAFLSIDGEGLPGDKAVDGIYLIFEIFLRPILIIFGLLASVVIFAAMVKVLNEIFSLVVQNLSGHDPKSTAVCGGISPVQSGSNIAGGALGGSGSSGSAGSTGGSDDPMNFFRGPIDELFFTVVYAIIVYLIGMSCFKLIDLVPNNILRYMGKNVNTFNDTVSDPAEGLGARLSGGGRIVSSQVLGNGGILQSLTGAVKGAGQSVVSDIPGAGGKTEK